MSRSIVASTIAVGILVSVMVCQAVAAPEPMTLVHVHASSYSPNVAEQTAIVRWSFRGLGGSTTRSVTDSSGMNLFDSGLRGNSAAPYAFRFWGAGTYPYDSSNLDEGHHHRLHDGRTRREDTHPGVHHRVSRDALTELP